jgi:phosphatidylserine decarboxylase
VTGPTSASRRSPGPECERLGAHTPASRSRPLTTIDRAALPAALISAAPAAVAAALGRRRTAAALLALPAGVVAFFRDPDRGPDVEPVDESSVVAPADGVVMHAGPAQDGVAPPGDWQQVSIFLSLLNVHVNRSPYAGRVASVTHRPGRWHAAYSFESATENERSEITLVHRVGEEERRVVFRQIVGLAARRVVTRIRPGDSVSTGQRIGLMKFGSRMDVFVPPHVQLRVEAGARTVAGETVIATWPTDRTR